MNDSVRNCKGDLLECRPQLFPSYCPQTPHQLSPNSPIIALVLSHQLSQTPHQWSLPIVADARVPTLWELIRKGIERQLAQASWTSRSIFKASVWAKNVISTYGLPGAWLLDKFVFAKVKSMVGGEIFWSLCGGSALSEDTQRLISGVICPPGGAYGMTETCA